MRKDATAAEKLLAVDEVAAALGMKSGTIWAWIRRGQLTALRFGRTVRVRQSVLDRLLVEGLKFPETDKPRE